MALLGTLGRGKTLIENFAPGDDCSRTLDIIQKLGIHVERQKDTVTIAGKGLFALKSSYAPLDAGNSGSTARMACGLLAGQPFDSRLDGDASLRRRPMERVIEPLQRMGARFESRDRNQNHLPLVIRGGNKLRGIDYELPVPSAQVKTAILFAGLHAEGSTRIRESNPTRDHTEIALSRFGVPIKREAGEIVLQGMPRLEPTCYRIPGDISSAAFFITAATVLPGSDMVVEEVGLNPTRTGFIEVLKAMGAEITTEESSRQREDLDLEPVGTIHVKGMELTGTEVSRTQIPTLIDEIPVLAVAAAQARGQTTFHGVSELRHKESDRLQTIADGVNSLGAEAVIVEDRLIIRGGRTLKGARLESNSDHRMAMAWAIAALVAGEDCEIVDRTCVDVSYPQFWEDLDRLVS
jgi:3-phosphoshikimate 1-carboxyvinyltransferase